MYGSSTFYDSRTQLVELRVRCTSKNVARFSRTINHTSKNTGRNPSEETFEETVLRRHAMNKTELNLDYRIDVEKKILNHPNLPQEIIGALSGALQNLFNSANDDPIYDYEDVRRTHPLCTKDEIPYLVATKLNGEDAVPTGAVTWVTETLPKVSTSAVRAFGQVRYQRSDGSLVHGFASLNFAALSCDRFYAVSTQGDFGGSFVRIPQTTSEVLNLGVETVLREVHDEPPQQQQQDHHIPKIYARSEDSIRMTHIVDADKILGEIEIHTNSSKSLNLLSLNASYHVIEPLGKVLVVSPDDTKNIFVEPEIRDEIILRDNMSARHVYSIDSKATMRRVGWYISDARTQLVLLPLHGPLRLVENSLQPEIHSKKESKKKINIVEYMEMQVTRRGFFSNSDDVFQWHDASDTFVSELLSRSQRRQHDRRRGVDKKPYANRHMIELQVKPNGGVKFK